MYFFNSYLDSLKSISPIINHIILTNNVATANASLVLLINNNPISNIAESIVIIIIIKKYLFCILFALYKLVEMHLAIMEKNCAANSINIISEASLL